MLACKIIYRFLGTGILLFTRHPRIILTESVEGAFPRSAATCLDPLMTSSIFEGDWTMTSPVFRDIVRVTDLPRKRVNPALSGAWQKYMILPSLSTSSLPFEVLASKISPDCGECNSIVRCSLSTGAADAGVSEARSICRTGLVPSTEKW